MCRRQGRTWRGRGCQCRWSCRGGEAAAASGAGAGRRYRQLFLTWFRVFWKKERNVHYKKIHVIWNEELKLCNVHLVKAIKFLVWNSCLPRIFVSNSSLRIMIRIFVSNSSLRIIFLLYNIFFVCINIGSVFFEILWPYIIRPTAFYISYSILQILHPPP